MTQMNLPTKQQHSQREQTCGYRGGEDGLGSLGLMRAARMLSNFNRVRLCNSMDCSPPGSSAHGILQARILEWDATPSTKGSFPPRD